MARNVATFLWRTLFVQAICRDYVYTALELASVPLLAYVFEPPQAPVVPLGTDAGEVDLMRVLVPEQLATHVVFGPDTSYNLELMTQVDSEIRKALHVTTHKEPLSGRSGHKGGSAAKRETRENGGAPDQSQIPEDSGDQPHTTFFKEASADSVSERCTKISTNDSGGDTNQTTWPLCVWLPPPPKGAAVASLTYTLFMPVGNLVEKETTFPLAKPTNQDADLRKAIGYQFFIEKTHLMLQAKKPSSKQSTAPAAPDEIQKTKLGSFPGWIFGNHNEKYNSEISSVLVLGFLIPFVRRINAIEREFSSGLAEHQGVMGLAEAEFFFGHFLTIMITCLVESSSMLAVLYYSKENELAWAHDTDPSLLAFSFLLFAVGFTLEIIMVTWIFPKGMMAVLVGFLLWRIVPTNVTRVASKEGASLAGYFLIGKWEKLLVGVFPPYALFSVLRIIAISRDYEKAGGWSVVTKRALGRDTVTILEIWAVMLLTDIVKAFAAWYFSKVLPWSTGNPQNPSFFLTPSYWKPIGGKTQDANPDSADPARFEELPADTPTVIVAKNLTKVYGHKTALDGLNLKIYQSRITVLLGHNGAGKSTLMNILTGMQAPTSGVARVCGYNVTTHRNEVRQLVSFCQQTDVFFDNMTVIENLLYFGSLKGVPMNKLRQSIASTLEVVDLQDKAYAMPNELSGGMKRRLSIAITIVSQPQVLILDEPTAGMDPETRRHVWDTLQVVAKERTLLLSSHDMNEADAIGDQVVVMASGKTICSGSTAFLKKACGVGYKLILEKVPKAFNLQKVFGVVEKVVPTATVEDEKKGEVTIALKTLDHSGFPVMFETLEGASQKLGIGSIGVSVSSMKDVYLKINLDWAPEGKAQEVPVDEKDIDAVIAPINKQRTAARVFIALFIKRLIHLVRSRGILLGCVVLPLGLLALMSWQLPMPSLASQQESFLSDMKTIPVSLAVHCPGSVVVIGESPATRVSEKVRVLVESEGSSVQRATDVRKELNAIASEDLPHYMSTYAMALEFRKDTVTLMPNPTSPVSLPILLNLFITSRLLEQTRQPLARITATIAYIQSEYVPAAFTIFLYRLWVWFHWASLSAFSYSLGFAAYAAFPVAERLGGAREVQLMTGMWGAEFVFAHFVFDMLHHAAFAGAWSLIQFAFSSYSIAAAGNYYVAFLSSGPAVIGMTYLIAERSLSTGGAISSVLLWIYLGGLVSLPLSLLGTLAFGPKQAHYIFLAFPPYALLSCFQKIWVADAQAMECELLQKEGSEREPPVSASAVSFGTGAFFPQASPNEDAKEVLESLLDVCNAKPLYALEYNAMGFEILALLATGLACLGTMAFLTSGFLLPGDAFAGKEVSADEDVEEEKKVIATLRDKKNFSDHTMLAWNLHKRFGDVRAVRGVYVALKPSECFGLLGVNGAGKTTTFQMLAGLESVSYGDAMTQTALLSKNVREWQSQISYCFQTGGLIDSMNAYEYLYLIGRLRGISNADLKPMVASIVNVVDLQEHAWKECGVYSGGNRRKLCIGATLLGLQPFVFLDEPYAGVDVVSRNKIFRAIAEIKKRSKTSFMLTSHNMDECEYSCDRLTIMVGGQMMCLGTLQHLREKFGRGFRMEFMLKHTATADAGRLASAVEQQFSGIRLTDWHENVLCYHLEQRIPWSTLFTKLAQLEKEFALEHALVGENTLEQIFLSFAKMQGHSVQPDTIGQNAVAAPPVVILQPSSTPSTASARVSKSGSTKSGLSS